MGGLKSTRELVELCQIDTGAYVLDVGCGVGATPSYLARRLGCRVVALDVSARMIARARERAKRDGIEDRVEFRVADVQELPFEDGLFHAVICESVMTFVEDKQKALGECVRVTKPGGRVGLNEEIWIKMPPPPELVEFAERTWDIKGEIPTSDGWVRLLEGSGLRDVAAVIPRLGVLRESSQVKRYGVNDLLGMLGRIVSLYARSSAFRAYMKERRRVPKGLFEYLGYGLFVGRK